MPSHRSRCGSGPFSIAPVCCVFLMLGRRLRCGSGLFSIALIRCVRLVLGRRSRCSLACGLIRMCVGFTLARPCLAPMGVAPVFRRLVPAAFLLFLFGVLSALSGGSLAVGLCVVPGALPPCGSRGGTGPLPPPPTRCSVPDGAVGDERRWALLSGYQTQADGTRLASSRDCFVSTCVAGGAGAPFWDTRKRVVSAATQCAASTVCPDGSPLPVSGQCPESRSCANDPNVIQTRAWDSSTSAYSDWTPDCPGSGGDSESRFCASDPNVEQTRVRDTSTSPWSDWTPDCPDLQSRVCRSDSGVVQTRTRPTGNAQWSDWTPECPELELRSCENAPSVTQTRIRRAGETQWSNWTPRCPESESRACESDPSVTQVRTRPAGETQWSEWSPPCLESESRICDVGPAIEQTRTRLQGETQWSEWAPACLEINLEQEIGRPDEEEDGEEGGEGDEEEESVAREPHIETQAEVCESDPTVTRLRWRYTREWVRRQGFTSAAWAWWSTWWPPSCPGDEPGQEELEELEELETESSLCPTDPSVTQTRTRAVGATEWSEWSPECPLLRTENLLLQHSEGLIERRVCLSDPSVVQSRTSPVGGGSWSAWEPESCPVSRSRFCPSDPSLTQTSTWDEQTASWSEWTSDDGEACALRQEVICKRGACSLILERTWDADTSDWSAWTSKMGTEDGRPRTGRSVCYGSEWPCPDLSVNFQSRPCASDPTVIQTRERDYVSVNGSTTHLKKVWLNWEPECPVVREEVCRATPDVVRRQTWERGDDPDLAGWSWTAWSPESCPEVETEFSACGDDPTVSRSRTRPVGATDWSEWELGCPGEPQVEETVQSRACPSDPDVTQTRTRPAGSVEWSAWSPTCPVSRTRACPTRPEITQSASWDSESSSWSDWSPAMGPWTKCPNEQYAVCYGDRVRRLWDESTSSWSEWQGNSERGWDQFAQTCGPFSWFERLRQDKTYVCPTDPSVTRTLTYSWSFIPEVGMSLVVDPDSGDFYSHDSGSYIPDSNIFRERTMSDWSGPCETWKTEVCEGSGVEISYSWSLHSSEWTSWRSCPEFVTESSVCEDGSGVTQTRTRVVGSAEWSEWEPACPVSSGDPDARGAVQRSECLSEPGVTRVRTRLAGSTEWSDWSPKVCPVSRTRPCPSRPSVTQSSTWDSEDSVWSDWDPPMTVPRRPVSIYDTVEPVDCPSLQFEECASGYAERRWDEEASAWSEWEPGTCYGSHRPIESRTCESDPEVIQVRRLGIVETPSHWAYRLAARWGDWAPDCPTVREAPCDLTPGVSRRQTWDPDASQWSDWVPPTCPALEIQSSVCAFDSTVTQTRTRVAGTDDWSEWEPDCPLMVGP